MNEQDCSYFQLLTTVGGFNFEKAYIELLNLNPDI